MVLGLDDKLLAKSFRLWHRNTLKMMYRERVMGKHLLKLKLRAQQKGFKEIKAFSQVGYKGARKHV